MKRRMPTAILLLLGCIPAASAAPYYEVRHTAYGCVDPHAALSLSSRFGRFHPVGWTQQVREAGRCFLLTPKMRLEILEHATGVALVRRVPPHIGEPPIYVVSSDIRAAQAPVVERSRHRSERPATRAEADSTAARSAPVTAPEQAAPAVAPAPVAAPPVAAPPVAAGPAAAAPAAVALGGSAEATPSPVSAPPAPAGRQPPAAVVDSPQAPAATTAASPPEGVTPPASTATAGNQASAQAPAPAPIASPASPATASGDATTSALPSAPVPVPTHVSKSDAGAQASAAAPTPVSPAPVTPSPATPAPATPASEPAPAPAADAPAAQPASPTTPAATATPAAPIVAPAASPSAPAAAGVPAWPPHDRQGNTAHPGRALLFGVLVTLLLLAFVLAAFVVARRRRHFAHVEDAGWPPNEDDTITAPVVKTAADLDATLTPQEFRKICAAELERAGWATQLGLNGGGNGPDIVGHRADALLAVRCRLSRTAITGEMVDEAAEMGKRHDAAMTALVSNAPFSQRARDEAFRHRVHLLRDTELAVFIS